MPNPASPPTNPSYLPQAHNPHQPTPHSLLVPVSSYLGFYNSKVFLAMTTLCAGNLNVMAASGWAWQINHWWLRDLHVMAGKPIILGGLAQQLEIQAQISTNSH